MADPAPDPATDTPTPDPAPKPAAPPSAPSLVTDGFGAFGLVVDTTVEGEAVVCWLPAPTMTQLPLTKIG